MALFVLLLASIVFGDTINSASKNPSMAVNGVQRTSTSITTLIEQGCPGWSGDLNTLEGTPGASTCINGAGLGNAPTGDWYFIHTDRHYNAANYYAIQRAVGMTGAVAAQEYIRSQQSGTANTGWGAWQQVGGGGATGSNTANGYVRLSNGLIVQWGYYPLSHTNQADIWFPTAFPTACAQVVASHTAWVSYQITILAVQPSYFTARSPDTNTNGMRWIAIGY